MKLKFWRFEYEFDRDDAKIVVPAILLSLGLFFTNINPAVLLVLAAAYYLLYFFLADAITAVRDYIASLKMRCPHCKNRKIILQGYQGYKSDEEYPYYFCDSCKTTSILTSGGLLQI
jgi:hypothetical protein